MCFALLRDQNALLDRGGRIFQTIALSAAFPQYLIVLSGKKKKKKNLETYNYKFPG